MSDSEDSEQQAQQQQQQQQQQSGGTDEKIRRRHRRRRHDGKDKAASLTGSASSLSAVSSSGAAAAAAHGLSQSSGSVNVRKTSALSTASAAAAAGLANALYSHTAIPALESFDSELQARFGKLESTASGYSDDGWHFVCEMSGVTVTRTDQASEPGHTCTKGDVYQTRRPKLFFHFFFLPFL
jgi:hypothetical protein